MSRFFVCDTVYEDKEVIIEVLKQMGYSPVVADAGVELKDYHGEVGGTGHIVVPKAQIRVERQWHSEPYGDLAFTRQADGKYRLVIDASDRSVIMHTDPLTGKRAAFEEVFQRSYVVKATQRKLLNRGITGFRLDQSKVTVDAKGRVQVVLRR